MNLNPFDSNNNNKAKQCSGIKIRGIFSHDYKQAMNEKAMQFFEILLNSCHLHTSLYIYIIPYTDQWLELQNKPLKYLKLSSI